MTLLVFSFLLLGVAYVAGLVGALTGLGGGAVLIPVLVVFFHVDIHYAMGASLISVMATSSGAALPYLKLGLTNVRIGMFLEVGAVMGALLGALIVSYVPVAWIAIIFGAVMFFSAYWTWRRKEEAYHATSSHPWALFLNLEGRCPSPEGPKPYRVQNVPLAFSIMALAGGLSGLLGIGSGALKVLAMDQAMRLPYKVSTTTSNFIIGITAAVSAGIYFSNGYMDPKLTFPVLIGVVLGALTGGMVLARAQNKTLRIIFSLMVLWIGLEMIYKGLSGQL